MSDETKAIVEELKEIRLALFRSAASLDERITEVEHFLYGSSEYQREGINMTRVYRNDAKRHLFKDLDKKEDDAWQRLIDSLK